MNSIYYYIGLAVGLLLTELLYFRLADRLTIIDKPNLRSSHTQPTIRGGGIIFFIVVCVWFVYADFAWPWLMLSVAAVAVISFLDDLKPRPALIRFLIHLCAVVLLVYQIGLYQWPWWLLVAAVVICIGTLSAFNFMDGINGITGMYALVNLSSFLWIHLSVTPFSDPVLIGSVLVAVGIFLFFNFRARAVCFAGDVGSITLALLQIFLLLQLIYVSDYFLWVIVVLVYGLDAVFTLVHRLRRRENIFHPHRTHLYQYLANEVGWSHRSVALLYSGIQLFLNVVLVSSYVHSTTWAIWAALIFVFVYLVVRVRVSAFISRS